MVLGKTVPAACAMCGGGGGRPLISSVGGQRQKAVLLTALTAAEVVGRG